MLKVYTQWRIISGVLLLEKETTLEIESAHLGYSLIQETDEWH